MQDTECKNQNELNNQLSITTSTQAQEEQPITSPCEDCFTKTFSNQIQQDNFLTAFSTYA